MEKIQRGRWGRFVQALFDLNAPQTLELALPDVQPILDIENPRPESEIFSGNDLASGYNIVTGDGTGPSGPSLYLTNPTGSNRVCVVDRLHVHSTLATSIFIGIGSGAPGVTTGQSRMFRDTRRSTTTSTSLPVCLVRARTDEEVASVIFQGDVFTVAALGSFTREGPWVITPGFNLIVLSNTTANQLLAAFYWRERTLGSQETTA